MEAGVIGLGVGQYSPNWGETISNSDLNASHCLYTVVMFDFLTTAVHLIINH